MTTSAHVLSWAQPLRLGSGRRGVLVCHGFTGSPRSVAAWAEHLADAGFRVEVPRLPGHGTTWQELNDTTWRDWYDTAEAALLRLRRQCDEVHVAGLSMGGALALRLAAEHPADVASLALVNPSVGSADPRMRMVGLLQRFTSSVAGVASDICKPGVDELGYTRTPLRALASLTALWRETAGLLGRVRAPIIIFRSSVDHVVDDTSSELIRARAGSAVVEFVPLANSYHVATMDHDAPLIFARTVEFFDQHPAES